jgi:hypothetical protein
MITLKIPTVNDEPGDFDRLFSLWEQVNDECLHVAFDFSGCRFLRQNAVAFIGGLARLIEARDGKAEFRWNTLQQKVSANLAQNGFLVAFGHPSFPWRGNSIPFREDQFQDKNAVVEYLKTKWLGRGWVHVSERLRGEIIGRVWEIYTNAFEHGRSDIGVFSCGQHYPYLRELALTVVDFGVGIPANVRLHFANDPRAAGLPASKCLEWAFGPGNSTKTAVSRGVGLDLLKEFVIINNGRLEMFSHEGRVQIGKEFKTKNKISFFEGTLVNITLKCDESFYHLADEPIQGYYF